MLELRCFKLKETDSRPDANLQDRENKGVGKEGEEGEGAGGGRAGGCVETWLA
jgi:hypothetical protein